MKEITKIKCFFTIVGLWYMQAIYHSPTFFDNGEWEKGMAISSGLAILLFLIVMVWIPTKK